jgi:transcriptional regulator with XRE-family HTH domain
VPKQNLKAETLPVSVVRALARLGENIATARVRRGLRHVDVARKTGLALGTLQRIERGSPTTAISAYFTVLWVMGLEHEFAALAAPERDAEGMTLERARAPRRARVKEVLDADF